MEKKIGVYIFFDVFPVVGKKNLLLKLIIMKKKKGNEKKKMLVQKLEWATAQMYCKVERLE